MSLAFIDAHLHLQDERILSRAESIIARAESVGVLKFFCNATSESDWQQVVQLASTYSGVTPFLGIHPWFQENVTSGWQKRLAETLSSCPSGAGIGEIGLDKSRATDLKEQMLLFEAQLELAAGMDLPVSIHCVLSWQPLIDTLECYAAGRGLPPVMIHSFSGSTESMQRLVDIGCYISYSSRIIHAKNERLRDTFQRTPLASLLLETDAPDQFEPTLLGQSGQPATSSLNEPVAVAALYRAAAEQRTVNLKEFATQIWDNATLYAHKTLTG